MHKHREMTLKRCQQFVGALKSKLYPATHPVSLRVFAAPDRIGFDEAMKGEYRETQVGDTFGPEWSTHWFKATASIPADWAGTEVHFLFDSGSEACVWEDGVPKQALTGCVPNMPATRPEYILTRSATAGEDVEVIVEMACNHLFGLRNGGGTKNDGLMGRLHQCEIAVFDREAWDLLYDFQMLADLALHLPENTPRGGQALKVANNMVNLIDLDNPETWAEARALAAEYLAVKNGGGQHELSAIGHAHIDSAWLWPVAETKRKCYRTFATALQNMKEYPEYKFVVSQAAQWEWMKELQPAIYEQMLERAKEGRFIPAGGSWIEPDCNIPSGESLLRQFLIGQRYFEQELGYRCNEFWNPDVFGYSAQLPQILKGCGITYFLTQKLSWNQFNKMPSHTFMWEALDGSQVLTHFPPADTYNATMSVKENLFNVTNYKDHERGKESYLLFGYGDGGSGPNREMLERLKRMHDVDGLPKVEIRTPAEFFERLDADIEDPLVWVGELYFELHRGTYTSQANNKKWNRECEFLLRQVEMFAGIGSVLGKGSYPSDTLTQLWKDLLFNQFHDIIPGSSINEVYRDSDADYATILGTGAELRDAAEAALLGGIDGGGKVRAINTLSLSRSDVVELPEGVTGSQTSVDGKQLGVVSAPAVGYAVTTPTDGDGETVSATQENGEIVLENSQVRVAISADGRLSAVTDKRHGREVLTGPGNNFVIFEDRPCNWEAWDVDVFHLEKRSNVGAPSRLEIVETGPLRATVEVEYSIATGSTLTQRISLSAISPRVDFDTTVDWHEDKKFLKVEFPVNVRSFNASYEVQFGHVQRPTHMNTSWDMARFEVCGHKWADLSEPDYGVSLLTDSKYGYATAGNVMRISLLRAPKSPDEEADMGTHTFKYALFPHAGTLQQGGVVHEGFRFNEPLRLAATDADETRQSWLQIDTEALIIDTVKKAEDSSHLIVRLYEAHGSRGTAVLSSPLPVKSARLCNMMEDDGDALDWHDKGVQFNFTPFQVITLKLSI